MAIKYDIDKIFDELEKKVRESKRINKEEKTQKESPEDAPETQEVAPATSKTSEDTHGGDEMSKEIKDSPNTVEDGRNEKNDGLENKSNNSNPKEEKDNKKEKGEIGDIEETEKESEEYLTTAGAVNHFENRPQTIPNESQKKVEELFEKSRKKQENFKNLNRQEYLKKYILEIIKKIAATHAGIDKQDGSETFDKKQMLQHMLKKQNYKLMGDKIDLRDARYVQFFIDTSGVYGCGSNKIMHELMPEIISLLEKQGYECYIAACGNGFYSRDMVEDEYYGTRKTLEGYKAGKVSKISCPTPSTAAKMANEAEFSIILADFDGLSSICEMAKLCQKDKVPYLLSTEDRYPWEDPTLHDWVDPELCDYNPELVFDVSMDGNPTLEQYEEEYYNDCDEDYDEGYDENEYEPDDGYDYDD